MTPRQQPRPERQQPRPDTNAQPDYHCAFCGMPRDGSPGGSLGRRLPLCWRCAAGLRALEDGADDALSLFRGACK